jgi:hypothetical protein
MAAMPVHVPTLLRWTRCCLEGEIFAAGYGCNSSPRLVRIRLSQWSCIASWLSGYCSATSHVPPPGSKSGQESVETTCSCTVESAAPITIAGPRATGAVPRRQSVALPAQPADWLCGQWSRLLFAFWLTRKGAGLILEGGHQEKGLCFMRHVRLPKPTSSDQGRLDSPGEPPPEYSRDMHSVRSPRSQDCIGSAHSRHCSGC